MPPGSDRSFFLSTRPASPTDRKVALAVVAVSGLLFAIAVPFAGTPLMPISAFVASYQSALAITDVITAVLLVSQFSIMRTRALLLLAGGYLFTAAAAVTHALTFPDLFAPQGLLGGGSQTTVWLFMVWHGFFPLTVLGYALWKGDKGPRIRGSVTSAVAASAAAVVVAIALIAWIVTAWHDHLPVLLSGGRYTPVMIGVVSIVLLLCAAALGTLWLRTPHSVLDIWLMVVLCAWLFDIALSAMLNVARFDLGFYLGRLYGLGAAGFVLAVLLIDNVALQAEMSRLLRVVRREAAFARDHLAERERLFSAVVESSNDAVITKSLDGTITAWNAAAERLFGYPGVEAVGQHIDLIMPPDRRAETGDILSRIRSGEKLEQFETQRLHRSGRPIDIALTVSPVLSATGQIVGASKIARDITEAKRTRDALSRELEERQHIFAASQDFLSITDSQGKFVQVSPSACSILGYDPAELVGRPAIDFVHPDDLENARNEMRAARRGQSKRSFETRLIRKDGEEVSLNWSATYSAPVERYFFIGRDLTEKQAAEAQIRQVQKMDAVGQLTGGVAHDFNNILTVITGTIGILEDAVANRPDLVAIVRLIDEAAERGASLTKHLLAFARKQPLQPVEVDINALILEVAKLLRPTLGEHIEVTPMLAEDAWTAMIDPNQLTTAILNLALNARDAMPGGGKLALESRNVYLDEGYANMHSEVAVGHYVMVAVSDSGTGIPTHIVERVFDPFFTTKEVGKGTGLGLSMVFGFVKQSGGHIKIYSEEGQGTSVKIYLPRATGLNQTAAEAQQSANIQGGNEIILVVEDDALVRKYVVTQIASLGYPTLEAANAAEALGIIDSGTAIDLLFTDVIMPGAMNGRQLVDAALKRRPELKTLYTSGYTENAIVHHGRLDSGVLLLAKPYRKSELARMIRLALGG